VPSLTSNGLKFKICETRVCNISVFKQKIADAFSINTKLRSVNSVLYYFAFKWKKTKVDNLFDCAMYTFLSAQILYNNDQIIAATTKPAAGGNNTS